MVPLHVQLANSTCEGSSVVSAMTLLTQVCFLQDLIHSRLGGTNMSGSSTPSALGISSGFAGLGLAPLTVLGVVFWALSGGDFRRRVGAALMGAGVACSMGCTVGHGLYALSAASAVELRQRVSNSQQRVADDLRKANEDNVELRRSMLQMSAGSKRGATICVAPAEV